jgi:hypothetical protein
MQKRRGARPPPSRGGQGASATSAGQRAAPLGLRFAWACEQLYVLCVTERACVSLHRTILRRSERTLLLVTLSGCCAAQAAETTPWCDALPCCWRCAEEQSASGIWLLMHSTCIVLVLYAEAHRNKRDLFDDSVLISITYRQREQNHACAVAAHNDFRGYQSAANSASASEQSSGICMVIGTVLTHVVALVNIKFTAASEVPSIIHY